MTRATAMSPALVHDNAKITLTSEDFNFFHGYLAARSLPRKSSHEHYWVTSCVRQNRRRVVGKGADVALLDA